MATDPKRRRILELGAALAGLAAGTPPQFAAFIRDDTERWAPVVRASGARVE